MSLSQLTIIFSQKVKTCIPRESNSGVCLTPHPCFRDIWCRFLVMMGHMVHTEERLAPRMAEPLLRPLYLGEHSLLCTLAGHSLLKTRSQQQLVRKRNARAELLRKKYCKTTTKSISPSPTPTTSQWLHVAFRASLALIDTYRVKSDRGRRSVWVVP